MWKHCTKTFVFISLSWQKYRVFPAPKCDEISQNPTTHSWILFCKHDRLLDRASFWKIVKCGQTSKREKIIFNNVLSLVSVTVVSITTDIPFDCMRNHTEQNYFAFHAFIL